MNDRITMAVIAKRAGVHTTTVSLALRNHPSLPLATRQRLQALAADMGYHPDPALSALVAYRRQSRPLKRNPLLAYVTNWDSCWGWKEHPAHRDFFEGAKSKAADLGYQLDHFWLREEGLSHQRMSRILYSRGITGVILASHENGQDAPLDFDWSKFSGVKIDFAPREQPLHMVTNDQRNIVTLANRRIREAGYKRVGFVMPYWWDSIVEHSWSAGFLATQQAIPRSERVPILYYANPAPGDQTAVAGQMPAVPRNLLARWMETYRPEVVMSYGPFVLPVLKELGYSVPKDVAFVETFLDQPDGRTAGVHQNCRRVGELAIDILASQLHQHACGVPDIPTVTLVEGTWCNGESLPVCKSPEAGKLRGLPEEAGPLPYFPLARNRGQKVAV